MRKVHKIEYEYLNKKSSHTGFSERTFWKKEEFFGIQKANKGLLSVELCGLKGGVTTTTTSLFPNQY